MYIPGVHSTQQRRQRFLQKRVSLTVSSVAPDGAWERLQRILSLLQVTPPMQNLLPSLDAPIFTVWFDSKVGLARN
ncbi:hypothetical protein KIN20_015880 [Parelaphostrongylus tenuis]|uniref:Uncharacterized protein n=1 Tax=Parelaphostrongylus tenuis TaxID=148309 RepID=A0AAD5QSS4_PARTN|nr:hypothetical protein KIN20_015880 [Parelaphostrongylus tenuis]